MNHNGAEVNRMRDIDGYILTRVCGIDESNIRVIRHIEKRQNKTNSKREYLKMHSNNSNNSHESFERSLHNSYHKGYDVCSECKEHILTSDWESIVDTYKHTNDSLSCSSSICRKCRASNEDYDHDYDSLYSYKQIERLRDLYSSSTLHSDHSYNHPKKGCECSESDCHHVLLGSEFSDLSSLIEQKKNQKTIGDLIKSMRDWVISGKDNKTKINVLDSTSVIRYILIYIVLYFLRLV